MNKTKIIHADFPRKNPAEGWWFPEESLMQLAEILVDEPADLDVVEQKVEMVEE